MWWILLPVLAGRLISAGGTAGLMLVRTDQKFKDYCEKQVMEMATKQKEIDVLKSDGCVPARESRTNIAVMQRDLETIKGNMAEQRTSTRRQLELSEAILKKLDKP